jgi:transglutaminase-like putative cysteine protease
MPYFNIQHTTSYIYTYDVYNIKNLIKLYPFPHENQKLVSQSIDITGDPEVLVNTDTFGNKFGIFTINGPQSELTIISTVEIETTYKDVLADVAGRKLHKWADIALLSMDNTFKLFLSPKDFYVIWDINNLVYSFNPAARNPLDLILEFNSYVYYNFRYDVFATRVNSTLYEVWNMKAGVCQDFAHILIYMLQLTNIPARYVCGYICPNKDGLRGDGATHAWVEAYLPNYGWFGIDPTNNCIAQEKHIKMAVGRNYDDVSPVKGEYNGTANQTMKVTVNISYN